MAKQLELNGRHFWIFSEPHEHGWRAHVTEVKADGSSDDVGIEATGETRSAADDSAERKLRRMMMGR